MAEPTTSGPRRREAPGATAAIRPLWNQVYLPNLLIFCGQGATLPILVYAAEQLHGSSVIGATIVALNGLGTLLFDLPAGRIVARFGERRAAWMAFVLLCAGITGCLVARSVVELAIGVTVQASGSSLWSLVRITHLSRAAPPLARGRALSLFGGIARAGSVLGPLAFLLVAGKHDVRGAFGIYLGAVIIGFTWSTLARDTSDPNHDERSTPVRPLLVLRTHRHGLAVSGTVAFVVSLLRSSRNAIVPLWAAHLGLDSRSAATLFAFSSLVDLALFYPAGSISDRFGRRSVALPCIVLLSVGHLLVPFTDGYGPLFAASFVLALGNGLGAGIVMTLGADLTPDEGRPSFLAVWRAIADAGTTAGPLVDSAVIAAASLPFAGPVVAGVGLLAACLATRIAEPRHLRQASIIRSWRASPTRGSPPPPTQ